MLAITPCVMTQAVLAVPEIEYKLVLSCISRPSKTNKSVETRIDKKSEKIFVNRKVFYTFTNYYNKGAERKEGEI